MDIVDERWEEGIDHKPECEKLLELLNEFEESYELGLRVGGDGDPGETLMYLLDELIDRGTIEIVINN